MKAPVNEIKPNILFEVRTATTEKLPAQLSTDDIPEYHIMTWVKYGLPFITRVSSIVVLMISNVGGTGGNDLAIDDIQLRICSDSESSTCPSDETTTQIQTDL